MRIEAGKLDRHLEIIGTSNDRDASGQPLNTETVLATIAGQRLEYRAADIAQGPGKQAIAIGRYLIRYRSDLTTRHRVRVDGTTYAITSIAEPDRRATQILTLEQIK